MRQASSDKYTIAWFKLAECVARGEREKALGVYRLLSHSIDDPAYALQLEADILLTFGDYVSSCQKYYESALLYRSNGKHTQAAALCEHILMLVPGDVLSLELLVDLHGALLNGEKVRTFGLALHAAYEKKRDCEKIHVVLEKILPHLSLDEQAIWLSKATMLLVHDKPELVDVIRSLVQKTVTALLLLSNQDQLRVFLSNLQALDGTYYQHALSYLKTTQV